MDKKEANIVALEWIQKLVDPDGILEEMYRSSCTTAEQAIAADTIVADAVSDDGVCVVWEEEY